MVTDGTLESVCRLLYLAQVPNGLSKLIVSHTVGFLKGKSAIRIHRELLGERRMTGLQFWAKGYCVSTIGYDEAAVRAIFVSKKKRMRVRRSLTSTSRP